MPTVDLSDTVGLGLIISNKSGVIYTNQTAGTACLHPTFEGIYIPLRNDYALEHRRFLSPEIALSEWFEGPKHRGTGATNGLDTEDITHITTVLTTYNLHHCVTVNTDNARDSHEAWIHAHVTNNNDVFSGFEPYPRAAILTWANSD